MQEELWQSDQQILTDDLNRSQADLQSAITERLTDTFNYGIVEGSQELSEAAPFLLTYSGGVVNVGTGIAYNIDGERIVIPAANWPITYDSSAGFINSVNLQTDNGIGGTTTTPQSTGSGNITPAVSTLVSGQAYFYYISYLQTTDPNTFTLQEVTNERLFVSAGDGYQINAVLGNIGDSPASHSPLNALFLGTVAYGGTVSMSGRTIFSLNENSLQAIVPGQANSLYAQDAGAIPETYSVGKSVNFVQHVEAVGTGIPSDLNPHGLSINDLTGILSQKTVEESEQLFMDSGISGTPTSVTSSLYGAIAGSPSVGPLYNYLSIKALLPFGSYTTEGDGTTTIFTLPPSLSSTAVSNTLTVYVNGNVQSPSTYTVINTAPAWNATTFYQVGNIVSNDGYNYICILDNTNKTPPNATYWTLYSATVYSVQFTAAPSDQAPIVFEVVGEAVQIDGVTFYSKNMSTDVSIYFYNNAATPLPLAAGIYVAYIDSLQGLILLAGTSSGQPVYQVYQNGALASYTITPISQVIGSLASPHNFPLWQVTWNDGSLSALTDLRLFGTIGNTALQVDSATDTFTVDHNEVVTGNLTVEGTFTAPSFNPVPVGTIFPFAGTSLPSGWLECNGASYPRVGTYANLYATINISWGSEDSAHFNVPDFRGVVLRGWNHGKGSPNTFYDPDAASRTVGDQTGGQSGDNVGSYQLDEVVSHAHSTNTSPNDYDQSYGSGQGAAAGSFASTTGSVGGNETRMKNASVLYMIKY